MAQRSLPPARGRKPAAPSRAQRDERLLLDLVGVRAAVMTAVLCLRGRGVDDYIATNLQRAAVNPLERALAALGVRS
jgi:hypothetical protein